MLVPLLGAIRGFQSLLALQFQQIRATYAYKEHQPAAQFIYLEHSKAS
jgi:hypothetical protein